MKIIQAHEMKNFWFESIFFVQKWKVFPKIVKIYSKIYFDWVFFPVGQKLFLLVVSQFVGLYILN